MIVGNVAYPKSKLMLEKYLIKKEKLDALY